MKLLTKAILNKLPKLYATDGNDEAKAIVKFFGGSTSTYYAFEFDGIDNFFGHVDLFGDGGEFGYFSLKELQGLRFEPFGLPIERDLYTTNLPTKKQLMEGVTA